MAVRFGDTPKRVGKRYGVSEDLNLRPSDISVGRYTSERVKPGIVDAGRGPQWWRALPS